MITQVRNHAHTVLFLIFLALAVSCSSDTDGSHKAPSNKVDPLSQWNIHLYVGKPGQQTRVDLSPVPDISFPNVQVVNASG